VFDTKFDGFFGWPIPLSAYNEMNKKNLNFPIFAVGYQRFWSKTCGYFTYLNVRNRPSATLSLAYFSSKYQRV